MSTPTGPIDWRRGHRRGYALLGAPGGGQHA